MIILFIILIILFLINSKISLKDNNQEYISKKQTTIINGLFVIIVFFSHCMSYIDNLSKTDLPLQFIIYNIGQLMVTTFLFYSGYGIYESIKKNKEYKNTFFKKRFIPTFTNFIIAVILFMILNIFLGNKLNINKILLSLIGWDSIGNSNWYMFAIFSEYIFLMLSFKLIKKDSNQIHIVMILSLLYTIVLSFFKPQHWYDTIICFPAGMYFSYYKNQIEKVILNKKHYWRNLIISIFIFISLFFLQRYFNNAITYNLFSISFISIIILISIKIEFNSKLFEYIGTRVFWIYILQRIPMILLKNIKNYNIYFILCLTITIILSEVMYISTNKLNSKLQKNKMKWGKNLKQKPKAITNYIYSSFYQIFLIIVPLITAPYLARKLLPEAIGINSYVSSVITIFTSIGLIGLNNYSLREIAYVRDDKQKLQKTFSELFFLRLICAVITIIIYIIYALLSEYKIYFLVQLIAVLAVFIDIAWIYQGFEEFKVTVTRNFIVKILNIISIFMFIKGPEDLLLFMIISSIYSVLVNFILYSGVKNKVGNLTIKDLNIKKHIIPTLKLFVPQIASMVYLQCDKMMIKFLSEDISYVGFYDQAERIIKIPLALITALSTVMLPRLANEHKNNNQENVKNHILSSFKFSLLMAIPLMFGVIAIANNFIPWFLGEGYEAVIPTMMILSIIVLFISLSSVTGNQYLTAINKTKVLTIATISGAIINCIINFLLIPRFNAIGAAFGTITAELTVFLIEIYHTKEIIKIKDLFKCSKNYIISGIIMFLVTYTVGYYLEANIISTIIQITSGGLSYFIILYISKDKFFLECIKKVLNLFKINIKIKE